MSDSFCGSFGINTTFGFATSNAADGAVKTTMTSRQEILGENLSFPDSKIGGRGLTGRIDPTNRHLRNGQRLVTGGVVLECGPNEIGPWINQILGSTTGQTEDAWTAQPYDIAVKRDLVPFTYRYCLVTQAQFSCETNYEDPEQQILQLALNFLGIEQHGGAVTFPAAPTGKEYFWIQPDSLLTIDGVEYNFNRFTLRVQNQLVPTFRNKLVPGCFRLINRLVTLDVELPLYGDAATALLDDDFEGDISIEMVPDALPDAADGYSTVFSLSGAHRMNHNMNTRNRAETPLRMQFQAFQKGSVSVLSIQNEVSGY